MTNRRAKVKCFARCCARAALPAAVLAGLLCPCCAPPERPAGRSTSLPASRPPRVEPADARAELQRLESEALQADRDMDHGRLARAADAMAAVPLPDKDDAVRRDERVRGFRARAIELRDGLHRFLFVELTDLPPAQRKELLDAADTGQPEAPARAAAALAEHEFRTGRRYLRATPDLRAGTVDRASGLAVRPGGNTGLLWQRQFNDAFNAEMRRRVIPSPSH